jgi:hypothetical protein
MAPGGIMQIKFNTKVKTFNKVLESISRNIFFGAFLFENDNFYSFLYLKEKLMSCDIFAQKLESGNSTKTLQLVKTIFTMHLIICKS